MSRTSECNREAHGNQPTRFRKVILDSKMLLPAKLYHHQKQGQTIRAYQENLTGIRKVDVLPCKGGVKKSMTLY